MTDTMDTTDNVENDWTDTETLAREFHVSSRTIRRLCARGDVPAIRIGRQWRIRRSDWEQYLVDWALKRDEQSEETA